MPDLDAIREEMPELKGLTKTEFKFVSVMNEVCVLLARYTTRKTAIAAIRERFDCTEDQAARLLDKADDFLASGVMTNAARAKDLYLARLQKIFDLCMSRSVENQIEVTRRPMKLEVENGEGGKSKTVSAEIIKSKPNALNIAAVRTAMEAAEQIARISGIVVDKGGDKTPHTVNVQINNMPGAQMTHELSNKDLAQLAGFDYAEVPEIPLLQANTGAGSGSEPEGEEGTGQDDGDH